MVAQYLYNAKLRTQVDVKHDTLDENPSSRRNGLRVKFYCEQCEKDLPMMLISQHKGQTFIGWDQ
jgi:hypothetical protein